MRLIVGVVLAAQLLASASLAGSERASEPEFTSYGDMLVYSPIEEEEGFSIDAAKKADAVLWEDGVLPLGFDESIPADRREMLFSACAEWGKHARVRCQDGPYKGRTLRVTNYESRGCFALWGMGTSFVVLRRMMNLASGCWKKRTLLHELGHAFGLIHEHQRPDRDRYVVILKDNIEPGFLGLQEKVNFGVQPAQLDRPYDFLSIMHYSRRAFSVNGRDTLIPRARYREFVDRMGRSESLSKRDAEAIAAMYGAR